MPLLATLRRLAKSGMIYNGGPEWDRFSVRNLGLRLARISDGLAGWRDVFGAIPDFNSWSRDECAAAEAIARARREPTETRYLRLLQRHGRLRAAVLKLGSA